MFVYVCMRSVSASACVFTAARIRLVSSTRVGRFVNYASAAVYLSIAAITILRFMEILV